MSFERLAEEKLREAIEQGAFNHIGGMGQPLRDADDDFAGEDWIGLHVLRQNGFLPEWLELRKQIYLERDTVGQAMREWERAIDGTGSRTHALAVRAAAQYRLVAAAINLKIDLHNIRCPSFQMEIARFREDALPANW